jgi:chaperone modulatory protein CbpM
MTEVDVTFTITEFCQYTDLSPDELSEVVGLGLIEPKEIESESWLFDGHALVIFQRAQRLHQELELDWSGIALAITLLDNIEHLKEENRQLHKQLSRFLLENGSR